MTTNSQYYLVKTIPIHGGHYSRVKKEAFKHIREIEKATKRKPYLKSKYFNKEKVFISIFMSHLFDKKQKERVRRLKLITCAIELIKHSNHSPTKKISSKDILYRFYGITRHQQKFIVQIKEDCMKRKFWISVYPKKG